MITFGIHENFNYDYRNVDYFVLAIKNIIQANKIANVILEPGCATRYEFEIYVTIKDLVIVDRDRAYRYRDYLDPEMLTKEYGTNPVTACVICDLMMRIMGETKCFYNFVKGEPISGNN